MVGSRVTVLTMIDALIRSIRRNPATNLRFDRWQPQTSTDKNLLLCNIKSETMLRTIFTQFRELRLGYQLRTNALAPMFGDGHFVRERDGQQLFVELKEGLIELFEDNIKHYVIFDKSLLFTWRHQRDWLLSIPSRNGGGKALLIPWAKLPNHWRESGYTGENAARASMGPPDHIEQYLLPWPGTGRQRWQHFCAQVADRLGHAVPPSYAQGPDFLRTLPNHIFTDVANEGDVSHESRAYPPPEQRSSIYNASFESQYSFAYQSASAFNSILVNRYACSVEVLDFINNTL